MLSRSWFRRSVVGRPASPRLLMACFAALLAAPGPSAAEEANWTVLTVARNGSWGIASARTQGEAIAGALLRCRAMRADASDCGAELVAFRSGLALALMCGDHHVIVTGNDFGGSRRLGPRSAAHFAGPLRSRFSGVPAPAANRLPWHPHNFQGEADRKRLLSRCPKMTTSLSCPSGRCRAVLWLSDAGRGASVSVVSSGGHVKHPGRKTVPLISVR